MRHLTNFSLRLGLWLANNLALVLATVSIVHQGIESVLSALLVDNILGTLRDLWVECGWRHSCFRSSLRAQHLVWVSVYYLGGTVALIVVSLVDRESQLGIGTGSLLLNHVAAPLRDFWCVSGLGTLFIHGALKILLSAHLEGDLVFHEF